MSDTVAPQVPDFAPFIVLLDDAAVEPQLGFNVYADAFAQIIEHSRPQFAIGIFGDWGSGKTTLMRAVKRHIDRKPDEMLAVWFNAWRYEREEHLIVPLLDNLRDELLSWGRSHGGTDAGDNATRAASLFGRAGRAFLRGLSINAGVPGLQASWSLDRTPDVPPGPEAGPASFYHAAFEDMRAATEAFAPETGGRRVVVFVDDLDRCLPTNALQVLESMKLFFDFLGFVFVVGLDQGVIERSIEAKYEAGSPAPSARVVIERNPELPAADGDPGTHATAARRVADIAGAERAAPVSGADYIKKIFQVPFTLPRIGTDQLGPFVVSLAGTAGLPLEQAADLDDTITHHLVYMTDRDSVNPREVKRLINAYTLQMKLLQPRLGQNTSRDTVLAIQLMGFRPDWVRLYNVLLDDPEVFVAEMRAAVKLTGGEPVLLGEEEEPVPPAFIAYFRGRAGPLLLQESLQPYLSSAEHTRTIHAGAKESRKAARSLRRIFRAAARDGRLEDPNTALRELSALRESLSGSSAGAIVQTEILPQAAAVEHLVKEISGAAEPEDVRPIALRATRAVELISDLLQEIERQATLPGRS